MVDSIKSWFSIVHVLWLLVFAFVASIAYVVNWKADLESRVHILEERGSPHLAQINNRLTVLESTTQDNKNRLDNVISIMTRELGKQPQPNR